MSDVKLPFNFDEVNEDHKDAVKEISKILKSLNQNILAEMIEQKFKLVKKPKYEKEESEFIQKAIEFGFNPTEQGITEDNGIEYPIVNIMADVREWNKFWEKYGK
jgi:hypothetical protein